MGFPLPADSWCCVRSMVWHHYGDSDVQRITGTCFTTRQEHCGQGNTAELRPQAPSSPPQKVG